MNLSEAIKHHRRARQLSQTRLAEVAGVGVVTIINLESPAGQRKSAQLSTLARMAAAMNISLSELLSGVPNEAVM